MKYQLLVLCHDSLEKINKIANYLESYFSNHFPIACIQNNLIYCRNTQMKNTVLIERDALSGRKLQLKKNYIEESVIFLNDLTLHLKFTYYNI